MLSVPVATVTHRLGESSFYSSRKSYANEPRAIARNDKMRDEKHNSTDFTVLEEVGLLP